MKILENITTVAKLIDTEISTACDQAEALTNQEALTAAASYIGGTMLGIVSGAATQAVINRITKSVSIPGLKYKAIDKKFVSDCVKGAATTAMVYVTIYAANRYIHRNDQKEAEQFINDHSRPISDEEKERLMEKLDDMLNSVGKPGFGREKVG